MDRQTFAARVWAKLLAHEKAEGLLAQGQSVLAAVSGGPDSVCLAHFLAQRARPLRLKLSLLHVHHGLRREADADARFVERLGETLGLPVAVARVDVRAAAASRRAGLEEAARHLRYREIVRRAKALRCAAAATGHQADDQAETVLLNLIRGTRLAALGGIPPKRPLAPGLDLIRPLLPLSREEVFLYLKRHGLSHRKDRSNESMDFTRNWLRRKIIPALETRQPRLKDHLAGIARQARALDKR